jgi:predicted kinase
MINCSLSKESQLAFTKAFSTNMASFNKTKESAETFDLEEYISNIISKLEKAGKDQETILNYLSLIPTILTQAPLVYQNLRGKLRNETVYNLIDKINDTEDIEELRKFFFEAPSEKSIKKAIESSKKENAQKQADQQNVTNENVTDDDVESPKFDLTIQAVPASVLGTTQSVVDKNKEIKPEHIFYNDFLGYMGEKLAGDNNINDLDFRDSKGRPIKNIRLRVSALGQVVPNLEKRKQVPQYDLDKNIGDQLQVVIITDEKGEVLHFKKEDNGKYTAYTRQEINENPIELREALPVYYNLRKVDRTKEGRYIIPTGSPAVQTPEQILQTELGGAQKLELYKKTKPALYQDRLKQIDEQQQREFELLYKLKQKVRENKVANKRNALKDFFAPKKGQKKNMFLQGNIIISDVTKTVKSRKFQVTDSKASDELKDLKDLTVFINTNLEEIIAGEALIGNKPQRQKGGKYLVQVVKKDELVTKEGTFKDVYVVELKFKNSQDNTYTNVPIGVIQQREFDTKNMIFVDFTGLSAGYVPVERTAETRTDSIDWAQSDVEFSPKIATFSSKNINAGEIYIDTPGSAIPMQMDSISNENINTINELLFNPDLKEKKGRSPVKAVSDTDRVNYLSTFLNLGDNTLKSSGSHISGIEIFAYPKKDKPYVVKISGKIIDRTNPQAVEEAKDAVRKLLTETEISKKGKDTGYTRVKYKINNQNLLNNKDMLIPSIKDNMVNFTSISTKDFIMQNSITRVVPFNNKIKLVNGYLRFGLSEDIIEVENNIPSKEEDVIVKELRPAKSTVVKTTEKKDNKTTPKKATEKAKKDTTDPVTKAKQDNPVGKISKGLDAANELDDIIDGLRRSKDLTLDTDSVNAKKAKEWVATSPLFDGTGIRIQEAFDVVNSNSYGTFRDGVITLWQGADYTVAYHEAWHAFSQHFLTKAEKIALYNHVAKTEAGKKAIEEYAKEKGVEIEGLTPLQKYFAVEELIAEDFREYMMSKGSKILKQAPQRNSIFRRIWNFLKSLFTGKDGNQMLTEMYENLRFGQLNTYTPSQSNRLFTDTLNKFKPVEGNTHEFAAQDLVKANQSVNGYFSEVIAELSANNNVSVLGLLAESPEKLLPKLYQHVRAKLQNKLEELQEQDEELSQIEQNNLQLLDAMLKNWGNSTEGMIAYHLDSIDYLDTSKVEFDEDAFRVTEDDQETMRFDISGNEISSVNAASKITRLMLSMLPEINSLGEMERDALGAPKTVPFNKAWAVTKNAILGLESPEEMINELRDYVKSYPWLSNLIQSLEMQESNIETSLYLRNAFFHSFNLVERNLHQLNINVEETITRDEEGKSQISRDYTITGGHVSGVNRYAINDFRAMFASAKASDLIIDTEQGNVLNVSRLLQKWDRNPETPNEKLSFLRDMGLVFPDVTEVREAIKNINVQYLLKSLNSYKTEYIDKATNKDAQAEANYISDLVNLFYTDRTKKVANAPEFVKQYGKYTILKTVENQRTVINQLAELHVKYSGNYANVALTTADGNTKYNTTLLSTLDNIVKELNKESIKSYDELVALPHMSYLKRDKFFMAGANPILKSLFEYNEETNTFGKRRPGIKFEVDDLTGVQTIINELYSDYSNSTVTAKMDRFTKMQSEIYNGLLYGRFGTTTHSDKSTTLTYYLNNIEGSDNNSPHLYVNPINFLFATAENDKISEGVEKTFQMLLPYIDGELERINKVNAIIRGEITLERIPGVTVPDKSGKPESIKGNTFQYISGIFSDGVLKELAEYESTYTLEEDLYNRMLAEFSNYFSKKTSEINKMLDGTLFIDSNLKSFMEKLNPSQSKLSAQEIEKVVLEGFMANYFMHQLATVSLLYGDVTEHNMAKHDFHKRNSAVAATGTRMFRTDDEALSWANHQYKNESKLSYAQRLHLETTGELAVVDYGVNEVINSAVIKDLQVDSKLMTNPDFKSKLVKKFLERGDSKTKMTKAQAEQAAQKLIDAYKNMEVADAQGYISFDQYRRLRILSDRWSKKQDALYYKIINNPESVTEEEAMIAFPPEKYQYYGPLHTEHFNAHAFHKFSLAPLIPNVVAGTPLENLHKQMIKDGITYVTHKTGSKLSDVVGESNKLDDYHGYLSELKTNEDAEFSFTPNGVYLKYLKNQLDVNIKKKGKVIFSTQMRKLIEEGMFNVGKSINQISQAEADRYEKALRLFMDMRMLDLKKELGMDPKDPNSKPDNQKLLKIIIDELTAQDIADHHLEFIKLDKDGNFAYDLSLGLTSLQIEHSLLAIVNNRLVRQKVLGESLVQMSNAMMEKRLATKEEESIYGTFDLDFYVPDFFADGRTLGAEVKLSVSQGNFQQLFELIDPRDNKKVGVVSERFYDPSTKKLVVKYNETESLKRLNNLIQDKEWRKSKENLELVTLTGVRIPVQGHNSMVYFIVKEFLPSSAGSIIIPPAELVAQAGSDFDIDKLSILMPHLKKFGNQVKALRADMSINQASDVIDKREALSKKLESSKKNLQEKRNAFEAGRDKAYKGKLSEEQFAELNSIKNEYKESLKDQEATLKDLNEQLSTSLKAKKITKQQRAALENLSDEISAVEEKISFLLQEQSNAIKEFGKQIQQDRIESYESNSAEYKAFVKATEEFYNLKYEAESLTTKAFENEMMYSIASILSLPQTYLSLVTPNSTDMFTDEGGLVDELKEYRDYKSNEYVHGKDSYSKLKGHTPATSIFEPAYNISIHEQNSIGKDVLGTAAVANTFSTLFARMGFTIPTSYEIVGLKSTITREVDIFLKHNRVKVDGKDRISMSSIYNKDNVKIADIINQIINGYVDVAKDAWIFDIQGNKQLAPTLLFLIQAGVPVKQAVYFLSNPLIKEYVRLVKKYSSPFAKITQSAGSPTGAAKLQILKQFDFKGKSLASVARSPFNKAAELRKSLKEKYGYSEFSESYLKKLLSSESYDRSNLSVFMHFLELEDHAKHITGIVTNFNNDTTKKSELFLLEQKEILQQDQLANNPFFNRENFEALKNTPIGHFFDVPQFQKTLWSDLFKFSADPVINEFLQLYLANSKNRRAAINMLGDIEKYPGAFKKDLLSVMYITQLKDFGFLNKREYKGMPIEIIEEGDIVSIEVNDKQEKVIKLNLSTLQSMFNNKAYVYSKTPQAVSFQKMKLATVNPLTFTSKFGSNVEEFVKFNIERELLRLEKPIEEYSKTEAYEERREVVRAFNPKRDNEQIQAYNGRIKRRTYEQFLRDEALLNIYNLHALFANKSTSISEQLYKLKEKYPELVENFVVLQDLQPDVSKPSAEKAKFKNQSSYFNIKLKDNRVDKNMFKVYAAQISDLSDPSSVPLESAEARNEIAAFFRRLPAVAMLQSGYDTSNNLSIIKALPGEKVIQTVQEGLNNNPINNLLLKTFIEDFNQQNSKNARNSRRRMKSYLPLDSKESLAKMEVIKNKALVTESNQPSTSVKPENISSKGSEFAKKLTNVGNTVGLTYKGKEYINSEHAYQTWKSGEFNQAGYALKGGKVRGGKIGDTFSIMTDILTEKLKQHPELVKGINERGGLAYIEQSTHNVIGDKFWESSGENKFIEALTKAYQNISTTQPSTSVKADVILPIGTSGSGKSTFIKSLPQENLVVIEPDAMRVEFTGDINDKSKDKEIYIEAAKRAVSAIKQGKQVVFDTTNLTKEKRRPFIKAIKKALPNANIQYKLMELNPELAKQRIKAQIARGEARANVSDATIDRHAESYKQMLEDIKSEDISNYDTQPTVQAVEETFEEDIEETAEEGTPETQDSVKQLKEIFSKLDTDTKKKLGGVRKVVQKYNEMPFYLEPQDFINQELKLC